MGYHVEVTTSQTVTLFGRVELDDGIYVVVIDNTTWFTNHSDPLEALRDVTPMVLDYLNTYEHTGQINERLAKLGFNLPLADILTIEIKIDVSVIMNKSSVPTVSPHAFTTFEVPYPTHPSASP